MSASQPRKSRSESLTGLSLGHYHIEEEVGAGGMGVVYRAIDTTLRRSVAIKVLPDDCAKDPNRRSRFEREARLLAALNHSHIAAIHGFEASDSLCFLVLEYVSGATLEKRVADGLDVGEALRIAIEIADALEAAHERNIIHRDLKPANIKITPDGSVKVLDFGLAKAFEGSGKTDSDETVTVATDETQPGLILGTAAYMSPEQARAQATDKRTDNWAFGCVLYEMLAGRRAFPGATVSDCVAAVLGREPDWTALPKETPAGVVALLRRCLQKDVHKRLRDIGDARLEIEEALIARADTESVPMGGRWKRNLLLATAAGIFLGAGAVAAVWTLGRSAEPSPVTKFSVSLPPGQVVSTAGVSVRLSADGSRLAYVSADALGRSQIHTRRIDQFEGTAVENTTGGTSPVFSPDARWIAFGHQATRSIRKIALTGGAPLTIAGYETAGVMNWPVQDAIYTTMQYPGPVVRVSPAGGTPQAVTTLDASKDEKQHTKPVALPGGKTIIFTVGGGGMDTYDDAKILAQVLSTGERKVLVEGGTAPSYSPTGHLIYARSGKLLAVPFNAERLEITGAPVAVLEGLFMCVNSGAAHYSLANNGTLAYAPGIVLGGTRELVWVDRYGKAELLQTPPRPYLHPRLSPDDKQLAVETEGPVHDFWTYEFARGLMSKVTTEGASHWPLWTPDGTRLTYRRWLDGHFSMWWLPADRSRGPERLTGIGRMQSAGTWSPDGRVVAFTQVNRETGADVFVMDLQSRTPQPFVQTKFAEGAPRFSPDGRWIAYTSNESGRNEIYVQQYPGPGPRIQVSTDGGTDPVWKRRGGEMYYRSRDRMMAVRVSGVGSLSLSKPEVLWTGQYAHGMGSACGPPGTTSSNYDVTADGSRFLMVRHDEIAPARINVVVNWTEELKRMMAAGRI